MTVNYRPAHKHGRHAFTLVELLVVIGIIALLISILLPSLNNARRAATQVKCLSNLRSLGQVLVLYNNSNRNYNVPSYNMKSGTTGTTATDPMDGWAPILDRDNFLRVGPLSDTSAFMCPNTEVGLNAQRMPGGNVIWPCINPNNAVAGTQNSELINSKLTNDGFKKLIRVGYWINADNPVGRTDVPSGPIQFYTASPGYKFLDGKIMGLQKASAVKRPTQTIVLVDGIYAGRQGDIKLADFNPDLTKNNLRIGYRHSRGGRPSANVAFADGHAGTLTSEEFPYAYDIQNKAKRTRAAVRNENLGTNPTCYANPESELFKPED